jgi:uncharacterized membrane protein YfcA
MSEKPSTASSRRTCSTVISARSAPAARISSTLGGGWGPIVTSTLAGAGHVPRYVIGSVNLTEFVVTVATSATFIVTLRLGDLAPVIPLVFGGLVSAPFAGYLVRSYRPGC